MMPFVVIVFVIWTIFNEGAYLTFKTILRKKQPVLGNESKVSCSKSQLEPLIGFETMIAVRRTDHCATSPLYDMYETSVCPTSEHFPSLWYIVNVCQLSMLSFLHGQDHNLVRLSLVSNTAHVRV